MHRQSWIAAIAFLAVCASVSLAEDSAGRIRKAVEHSTLDQPGTQPFHLKAVLAPSRERDKDSGRTGEVEIWWASPDRWRRELKSPGFHQVEIVNGARDWQQNEGDFFPEWLREIALELIRPVPPLNDVLEHAKTAETRTMMGKQFNIDWTTQTGTAEVHNIQRSGVALEVSTGRLLYAYGFGWGGDFKDVEKFHGRLVARSVSWGTPEVNAKVVTLEELAEVPAGFFDAEAKGADPQPFQTLLIDETTLRKNLVPMDPIVWPRIQDGSMEGNVTTNVVVDRAGKVREIGSIVSENSAVNDIGRQRILALQFKPFLQNGVPVQVMSQITLPFKASRPAGGEAFDTARTYFERGRQAGFPAAGAGKPYVERAEFKAMGSGGAVVTGHYEDTWLSDTQWRREASFEKSQYVRSRNGDKLYELKDGPSIMLLQLVFRIMEPIPAIDTFTESDWRIKRDTVGGVSTVRVLAGYESPEGKFDPHQSRGYWFDSNGLLRKTYFEGLETVRSDFHNRGGIQIPYQIEVLKDENLALQIQVTEVADPGEVPAASFELKGHSWQRAFTSEVR
jgi:hypothetical protein